MKGRVLILDDDSNLLELYSEILRGAGHEVTPVSKGATALKLLRDLRPDVVLSDISMPGMDGISFLQAAHETDPDLPVILATGAPSLETAIRALELGAVQYLLKPLGAKELESAVERGLRLRRFASLKREALEYLGAHDKLAGDHTGLDARLTQALASMWVAYQPIYTAKNQTLYGHEALLRSDDWRLPHPGAVIEAAERLGRLQDVGRATRNRVADFAPRSEGALFVNLHAKDLLDDNLFSPQAALSQHSKKVVLEITEREPLDSIDGLRTRVQRLKEMGFRIALDDLGAGYAGLGSFAALEPNIVKLDISVVRDVDSEPVKRKLIGSMVSLCRDLGVLVVAEGIETAPERDTIVELGCDLIQGFLLGRPQRVP